jgi:hypothetical protein
MLHGVPTSLPSPLSEPVARFVRERLPSVEQIDIVLLLRDDRERAWTAPEVAAKLAMPPESTAMRLFLLASNGVVAMESSGMPRYRYAAGFEELIDELADVYTTNREALTPIIGGPPDPLRSFADAFKLKR